jgi:protein gp37
MCFIEKWARIAAVDILLTNVFSRLTFTTISNLPIKDYQLLMKRVEEMVDTGRKTTYQSNKITDNIPGQ